MNSSEFLPRTPYLSTRTLLPELESYTGFLNEIWANGWVTNGGPLVRRLEGEMRSFLGTPNLNLVSNGCAALQIAIKGLGLRGSIVTTPFSYVATTAAAVWTGCEPVFADIDPENLTLDPRLAEAAIRPDTSAILATHVFGNPCDIAAFEEVGRRYGLPVIYDAAHAFGCRFGGRALAAYGDVSILSFHATKVLHTCEGGAVVSKNDNVARILESHRRCGHRGEEEFDGLGINAKMSELHAAMGLALMPRIGEILARRLLVCRQYDEALHAHGALPLRRVKLRAGTEHNGAYYPILPEDAARSAGLLAHLRSRGIFPRRYFYPPLHRLPYVTSPPMPVAESVSERILCLPLHPQMEEGDVAYIASEVAAFYR